MKIIHTSDIHLDSPLTSRLSADKVKERRRELLSNLSRMVSEARTLGAEAIIIAGDLFDSGKVSGRAMTAALDIIAEARDISFYYLPGNHEGDAIARSGRSIPENLNIFGDEWTYFDLGQLIIAGRSLIGDKMFDSLSLPEDKKSILVLHGELRDRSCAPESIGLLDARDKHIGYMALGHYHGYSKTEIESGVYAVYCGTPEGRGFDEAGEKGFVLIDTDGKRISHSFVPFAKRRLHIVELDVGGVTRTSELAGKARDLLKYIPHSDIVRLSLVGRYPPELWKDTEALEREFNSSFYYFEVKDCSRMAINPDDYKYDKSLKGEFIRTVSADESLDEQMKEKIIRCGINALMGEELFSD